MNIVAATQNLHKLKELREMVEDLDIRICTQGEVGLGHVDVPEDGDTFEANSEKKARTIMQMSGVTAIADDSGLAVEALAGAPGVYSARFAGENATDAQNNQKLLACMEGIKNRRAKFVSVITMVYPDGRCLVARGECHGTLTKEERGEDGFGYDSLFIPDGHERTFGEMAASEKNKISHRSKAMALWRQLLEG